MGMRVMALGVIVALLAGCSSDRGGQTDLPKLIFGTLKQGVQTRQAGPQPKVVVTPKMLAETKIAALQINPEMTGGSDFLRRVASRRDSMPGRVEIWKSSDNAQVFLRNGVVIGTRGVGGDIIAADAALTISAIQARAARSGLREYTLSDGDVTTTKMQVYCDIEVVGNSIITIVDQVFNTTHLREECAPGSDAAAVMTNDYWVQESTGLVRKSRQWVGPRSGYFELILLKN